MAKNYIHSTKFWFVTFLQQANERPVVRKKHTHFHLRLPIQYTKMKHQQNISRPPPIYSTSVLVYSVQAIHTTSDSV